MSIDIRASIRTAIDGALSDLPVNERQEVEDAIMEGLIGDLGRSTPPPGVITLDAIYADQNRFDAGTLFLPEGGIVTGSTADGTKVTSRDGEDITEAVLGKPKGWDVAPARNVDPDRMVPATMQLSIVAPGWAGPMPIRIPIGEDEISVWPAARTAEESRRNMALQNRDIARLLRAAADRQDLAAHEIEGGFR